MWRLWYLKQAQSGELEELIIQLHEATYSDWVNKSAGLNRTTKTCVHSLSISTSPPLCSMKMTQVKISIHNCMIRLLFLSYHIYIYVKVEFDFSLALLIGCGCSLLVGSSATLPHHFSTFHTALSFLPPTCGCLAALPICLAALSFLPLLSYCLPIGYLLGCWPTPNSRLYMDLL